SKLRHGTDVLPFKTRRGCTARSLWRSFHERAVVMQLLSIQGCCFASKTQRDGHLDLVTATLARPDMMDFVVAHVCRRLWRDQYVIAFAARHPRARAIVHPRGHGVET